MFLWFGQYADNDQKVMFKCTERLVLSRESLQSQETNSGQNKQMTWHKVVKHNSAIRRDIFDTDNNFPHYHISFRKARLTQYIYPESEKQGIKKSI